MTRHVAEPQPPNELLSFVERQIRNARSYSGVERRSQRRHLMAVPVLVQPVDPKHNPIGAPSVMVTRDISPTGIGLVHTHKSDHRLLAVQMCLAGEVVNVVVEIRWCRPLGPFEYLGGRFVARLDGFPAKMHDSHSPSIPRRVNDSRQTAGAVRRTDPCAGAPDRPRKDEPAGLPASR